MRVKADIGVVDIIGHLVNWLLLSLITFGIALFFYPYSFAKFIINRSVVVDEAGASRRMECHTDMFSNIGHIILWIIISLVTFGIGYVFYFYKVWNYSLNNTTIT
jgi:hypothetical protein